MSSQKRKGDTFERELATYFNETADISTAYRAPLSGGGKVSSDGGADLIGVPDLFVEAKRVERLNFMDAIRQAERNSQETNSPETPIVINRRNRMTTEDSICFLRLKDFMKYYNAYLKLTGRQKSKTSVNSESNWMNKEKTYGNIN